MRRQFLRISTVLVLAWSLAIPSLAAELDLSSDFDSSSNVRPTLAWGIEDPQTPEEPLPPIGPPPFVETPELDQRIECPPRTWVPPPYCGKGLEYSGEFCNCRPNDWCPPRLDSSPLLNIYAFEGFDTFRQIADGNQSQTGLVQGFNFGAALPTRVRLGYQFGASYGAYNLGGSDLRAVNSPNATQQIFVTTGFFHRGSGSIPISFGVVYDFMFTQNFGAFSQSPTLGQGRAQISYAYTARNEVGIMGAWDCQDAFKSSGGQQVFYTPVSQGNIFWNHKFLWRGAETRFWAGIPDVIRDNGQNGAGKMIFGLTYDIPVTDKWVVYFRGQHWDTTTAGASGRDVYDLSVGMTFYPFRTGRASTIVGRCFMPYMPVANNANFMSDINRVQ